jgi:hypothetical protein
MPDRPPSDGPTWTGPRGEEPSFPRRGRRGPRLLASAGLALGLSMLGYGLTGAGALHLALFALGTFVAIIAGLGLLQARRLRVCASCGGRPTLRCTRLPLDAADHLITAIELADPDRLARISAPEPGQASMELELLHCPHCRDLGWLRATARIEGSFLHDVLEELERR